MSFGTIIAETVLGATHETFVIFLVTICYLNWSKPIFAKALYLLLFSMVFNTFLKSIWQIPLDPALNIEGWAFPSGHMQNSTAFWGWIAYELKNKKANIAICSLLGAIGVSLIYMGWHNPHDIAAGTLFGIFSIILYRLFLSKIEAKDQPLTGFMLVGCSLLLISLTRGSFLHLWLAFGALIGFTFGWLTNQKYIKLKAGEYRLHKTIMAFFGIGVIYFTAHHYKHALPSTYLTLITFFAIAFWVSFMAEAIVQKAMELKKI